MYLHLVPSAPEGGLLVALSAGVRVEERPQTRLGHKDPGKDLAALLEELVLSSRKARERVSRLGSTDAGCPWKHQQRCRHNRHQALS
jgi:hypothetical protein